jgi:hypothetical protein
MGSHHENSSLTYRQNLEKFGKRARGIYFSLRIHGPMTERDIMNLVGFREMNSVRPRVTELKKAGLVEECGYRICPATGARVRVVRAILEPEWTARVQQQTRNRARGQKRAISQMRRYTGRSGVSLKRRIFASALGCAPCQPNDEAINEK